MVTTNLRFVGVIFYDEVRALFILFSLPKGWNILVMVVSNYVTSSITLKVDGVIGVIISGECNGKT